jgi:VanZ family protein
MVNQIKLWGPVAAWAGLIFCLSAIPDLKSGLEFDFTLRKIAHIFEYMVLTCLLLRAFRGSTSRSLLNLCIYSALLALAYAASDEFHQTFVGGRGGSFRDVTIDGIGILIAVAFAWFSRTKVDISQ